ncbi:arsenic resistance protein [Pseudomonas sp. CBSPBW29]|uniref:arsenic resistance protein n=1 Tax=Pseudomonas TaxID=286 RepID=UPI0021ABD606|nr:MULTISPECIES: arsenic resistance protein [unclassified Pseudomonas]WEL40324.1 arsenic resistance protein [Pseudomonas sp. CBSPBW29]WEL67071.1 arsenic resistance protein [Pseudomonas sp. CBSPGW29]WEL70573.1 arsenic resistance protein [Pseudomonas sp. CBSPCGW29]WEL77494.1 arsenic resistance protein [Pseudomonas sp. CBSPAW29]WEL83878.1 arsenic resistance protein [Pseudomonas sp. CBSPCAW29]WEL86723.1 arsenic resistance protein [Pseudomonas sp. CBSPCBW29]
MTRDTLEQNQIPLYFASVLLAVVVGLVAPSMAQGLGTLVTPAIAVLMYAMFLQIPFLDLRQGLGNKRFMAALLLANFILIPLLVWALTRGLADHPAILIGALLVLLTPCIDYVVVFTHIGKGDSRLMLAATPVLLLLQLLLLPVYLGVMLGAQSQVVVAVRPFVEAFLLLIVAPMILAVLTTSLSRRSAVISTWNDAWAWLPVPAMALVLMVVIGSQITAVVRDIGLLAPVIPVYIGFLLLAPLMGALASRLFKLPATTARAVTFSASTRNSLVVLPLALALPEDIRGLAAAAVITQTLVELVGELLYIRLVPLLIWPARR